MEFHARQDEVCSKCNEVIHAGEEITWNRQTGSKFHPACDKAETQQEPEVKESKPKAKVSTKASPKDTLGKLIEELLGGINEEQIRKIVQEEMGSINIIQVQHGDTIKTVEGVHETFEKLLYLIGKRHHAYLWGPPGSGKSTAARQ